MRARLLGVFLLGLVAGLLLGAPLAARLGDATPFPLMLIAMAGVIVLLLAALG